MDKPTLSALRVLIKNALGMPSGSVRPYKQNQPVEGGDNIAVLGVISVENEGWAEVQHQSANQDHVQLKEIGIEVNFLGESAATLASLLAVVFQRPDIQEQLSALNLSYLYCEEARDLSFLETDNVVRYQVIFYLSSVVSSTADINSLVSVDIDVTAENQ